jgi:hypothetical protein
MAIRNPNHVKGVRDGVHAGIQAFAQRAGLGNSDLDGVDAVTGIAMALRDIIQSSPDSFHPRPARRAGDRGAEGCGPPGDRPGARDAQGAAVSERPLAEQLAREVLRDPATHGWLAPLAREYLLQIEFDRISCGEEMRRATAT